MQKIRRSPLVNSDSSLPSSIAFSKSVSLPNNLSNIPIFCIPFAKVLGISCGDKRR